MTRRVDSEVHSTPDERRQQRRDQLLSAAIAVIRRQGAEVTMEEMASAGGISKPILYRHFTDRDGLVAAITETVLAELGTRLDDKLAATDDADPRASTHATIDTFFDYIEREPELYRFVVDSDSRRGKQATHAFVEQVGAHVAAAIAARLRRVGRDPAPADIWARAIVGMCQNTAEWWIAGAPVRREQLVDQLTELVLCGLLGARELAS